METRTLGWTGEALTTIGLGTWAQGGAGWAFGWGAQDDRESIAAIRRALELGVNWVDTAAVYGLGHAETVLGRALRGLAGPRPFLATKCCLVWDENGEVSRCHRRESVRREAEASLARLGVETIDLYQVHWPSSENDEENAEAWSAIAELVRAGKVRYGGVSNFSVTQIKKLQAIHPVASVQPPYSMLRRDIEQELLAFCAAERIGVIAYSPLQKGLLTDKFSREFAAGLPADDHRSRDALFREPKLSANLALVDRLRELARAHGRPVAQLALAWCLRRPEVTAAIVGARRPDQVADLAGAAGWRLDGDTLAAIDKLLAAAAD